MAEKDPAAVSLGRRGGRARAASLNARQRAETASQGAHAYWAGIEDPAAEMRRRAAVRAKRKAAWEAMATLARLYRRVGLDESIPSDLRRQTRRTLKHARLYVARAICGRYSRLWKHTKKVTESS